MTTDAKGTTMTTTDLDELRRLAMAATQPSPWTLDDGRGPDRDEYIVMDRDGLWVAECGRDEHNSAFIAAANPATVLALLDDLAETRKERDEANQCVSYLRSELTRQREELDKSHGYADFLATERDTLAAQLATAQAALSEAERKLSEASDLSLKVKSLQRSLEMAARDEAERIAQAAEENAKHYEVDARGFARDGADEMNLRWSAKATALRTFAADIRAGAHRGGK